MKPLDRNISILEHIIAYCDQIEETIRRFGQDYDVFSSDAIYRNAAALCILQIGELANHLSEEFKQQHNQIPWNEMRGIRNLMAHQYHSVDFEIIWDTSRSDIPAFRAFCKDYLEKDNG